MRFWANKIRQGLGIASALAATVFSAPDFSFSAYAADDFRNPESTTASAFSQPPEAFRAKHFMVSAANPLAVETGKKILKSGGSAIDAAIATQLVLNVVEPQSSGIGGGGFLLYYDAREKKLYVYDGRETAPEEADKRMFLHEDGTPLSFDEAMQGGQSVGTPGLLKMLELAHKRHGHMEWSGLFSDAMRLANDGFPMSARLHQLISEMRHMHAFPASLKPYLNEKGALKDVGETIVNEELYKTFSVLALKGIKPFYEGNLAKAIEDTVHQTSIHPGTLLATDLKKYKVKEREAICAPYRSYKICSMPPPSSGGVTLLQALGILERINHANIPGLEPLSADAVHYFAESSKLAYADRNRYLADPDFVSVPVNAMLSPAYLQKRAGMISRDHALQNVTPGDFSNRQQKKKILSPTTEEHPSTTHISVIDSAGNAVAMTTSIEHGFGSGLSVGGFLLNNQLTDFSFTPYLPDGTPHPNRIEPGKRPRSSMSPTMVFDRNGELIMVLGSPGGARIIEYVLQTLIAALDWKMDIQTAINLPHYLNMNGPTELEAGSTLEALKPELEARGHQVNIHETPSGLHGIMQSEGWLLGGADPRREGVARGE